MNLLFRLLPAGIPCYDFICGDKALDACWRAQAGHDQKRGFATVVVASDKQTPDKVIGFCTLAASALLTDIPEAEARRMRRYPAIPAIRLGRPAVASVFQGQYIRSLLVLDALRRSCCNELAWAIFLVNAKEEQTVACYEKFLFKRFTQRPLSLWMHRKLVEKIAGHQSRKGSIHSMERVAPTILFL